MSKSLQMRVVFSLLFAASTLFVASSCVPVKQVQDLREKYEKSEEEREYLAKEKQRLEEENAELKAEIERLSKKVDDLSGTSSGAQSKLKELEYQLERAEEANKMLRDQVTTLQSGTEAENRKLLAELMANQEELQKREDALHELEAQLNVKEERLNELSRQLQLREARVNELEELIAQKDAAVKALRDKVKAALTGFEDKGITVEQRNGRVYVSMEAKLLFASGSTAVGSEGKTAVVQLAKALEGQDDLTILVEGHTDSDPMNSSTIKDNWDLSVMRATSVVRIMVENSTMDKATLTAAGRGEFFPIADNSTEEGKAKNRRIEVILTPNLDKLFEILDEAAPNTSSQEETE